MWFWSLFLIELILLFVFVEHEWPIPSVASLIVFIFLIWWLADIPIWAWIKANPWNLLKYIGYYIIGGIVWSFIKFHFALSRTREAVLELKKEWLTMKGDQSFSGSDKTFKEFVHRRCSYDDRSVDPTQERTVGRLVFWASFWPISFIWTIINDPVRKFFRWLIKDVFMGIYKKMYANRVGKLLED